MTVTLFSVSLPGPAISSAFAEPALIFNQQLYLILADSDHEMTDPLLQGFHWDRWMRVRLSQK
jgi:hypothetical protein